MIESGYYPPGAEFDPNAPWNEQEVPERTFDVCVSQTLSKNTKVLTNDYDLEPTEEGCTDITTSNTNWKRAYEREHLTPLQLIEEFKSLLTNHLPDPVVDLQRYKRFKRLIKECEGWEEDETEIIED